MSIFKKCNNQDSKILWGEKSFGILLAFVILFVSITSIISGELPVQRADAAVKAYGIMIANRNGNYTFYDMNDSTEGKAAIEIAASGF